MEEPITAFNFTPTLHDDTYPFITVQPGSMAGKYVLVTGASRGIGKQMAIAYGRAGVAGIGIVARSEITFQSVKDEILAAAKVANPSLLPPKVLVLAAEITKQNQVEAMAEKVRKEFGRLDVLVNSAANLETWNKLADTDPQDWWRTFEVNIFGVYLMCRSFIPILRDTEGGSKTIVQITSAGANVWVPGASAYQTSKTWLFRLNDFIMAEYGDDGLLAYSVHPGSVVTSLALGMPEFMHEILKDTPNLCADTMVWLTKERREWLADRYVSVSWDMEEFEKRKDEVLERNLLKVRLRV